MMSPTKLMISPPEGRVSRTTSSTTSRREMTDQSQHKMVFGQVDLDVAHEIDEVAEQMLMPRSWVVAQILREWYEDRRREAGHAVVAEQAWGQSLRAVVGPGA